MNCTGSTLEVTPPRAARNGRRAVTWQTEVVAWGASRELRTRYDPKRTKG